MKQAVWILILVLCVCSLATAEPVKYTVKVVDWQGQPVEVAAEPLPECGCLPPVGQDVVKIVTANEGIDHEVARGVTAEVAEQEHVLLHQAGRIRSQDGDLEPAVDDRP